MSGPWEKYQKPGPWAKYARPAEAPTEPAPQPEAVPEQDSASGFGAAIAGAAQGVTFGGADELKAAFWGGVRKLKGEEFGPAYEDELGKARSYIDAARTEHPVTAYGSEVGGAVLPSLLTGGSLPALAAGSTAYGFGAGEGGFGERAKSGAISGAIGTAGGVAANKVGDAITTALARRAATKAAPSVEALKGQAGALYGAAEARGAAASTQDTKALADAIRDIALNRKVVMPSGKVAKEYGKVREAVRVVEEFAGQPMAPTEMKTIVRPILKDAAKAEGTQGGIGRQMLNTFDDWTKGIAPELRQADAIYAKAKQGNKVDTAIELALTGKNGGTASRIGTEFDKLRRAEVTGRDHLPDALAAEVERVAAGGSKPQKVAEAVGRMAPSDWRFTFAPGGALGLLGTALGGPGVGAAVGGGASATGMLSQMLANRLAKGGARAASAVARSGQPMPEAMTPEAIQALIQALMMTSGSAAAQ